MSLNKDLRAIFQFSAVAIVACAAAVATIAFPHKDKTGATQTTACEKIVTGKQPACPQAGQALKAQ